MLWRGGFFVVVAYCCSCDLGALHWKRSWKDPHRMFQSWGLGSAGLCIVFIGLFGTKLLLRVAAGGFYSYLMVSSFSGKWTHPAHLAVKADPNVLQQRTCSNFDITTLTVVDFFVCQCSVRPKICWAGRVSVGIRFHAIGEVIFSSKNTDTNAEFL